MIEKKGRKDGLGSSGPNPIAVVDLFIMRNCIGGSSSSLCVTCSILGMPRFPCLRARS